jgi:hypothetical protein
MTGQNLAPDDVEFLAGLRTRLSQVSDVIDDVLADRLDVDSLQMAGFLTICETLLGQVVEAKAQIARTMAET